MKIEVKSMSKPGYETAIYENGKMIMGIQEALISIKPDRMTTILTKQTALDSEGFPIEENGEIKSKFVIYCPAELSMEA
jgi:hypothetical protein